MRSVVIYLKNCSTEEPASFLQQHYPSEYADNWAYQVERNTRLWMSLYGDLTIGHDPEDLEQLTRTLGAPISTALMVDITSKFPCDKEVIHIATQVLERFEGVVTDDESNHPWTLQEIRAGKAQDPFGKEIRFFDHGWHF